MHGGRGKASLADAARRHDNQAFFGQRAPTCSLRTDHLNRTPNLTLPTVARLVACTLGVTSSTRIATTPEPRNLLSIADLNGASARMSLSICGLVLIDHARTQMKRSVRIRLSYLVKIGRDEAPGFNTTARSTLVAIS